GASCIADRSPVPTRRSSDLAAPSCRCVGGSLAASRGVRDALAAEYGDCSIGTGDSGDDVGSGALRSPRRESVTCSLRTCVICDRDRKSTRLNSSHLGISYAV